MRDSRECTLSSKGIANEAGMLIVVWWLTVLVSRRVRNECFMNSGTNPRQRWNLGMDFVCITMTIPATAMTTRQLFGGAITANLPKEYLDARYVDFSAAVCPN